MKTILQWPQLNCTTLPKLVGEKNPKFEFFSPLKVHCPKKITYDITFSVLFHPKISKSIWALKSLVFIFVTTDVALINAMNVQFQWKRLKPARLVNSLKASRGEQPNPCQSRSLLSDTDTDTDKVRDTETDTVTKGNNQIHVSQDPSYFQAQ